MRRPRLTRQRARGLVLIAGMTRYRLQHRSGTLMCPLSVIERRDLKRAVRYIDEIERWMRDRCEEA